MVTSDLPLAFLTAARRGQHALQDFLARRDRVFLRAWRDLQGRPLGLRLMDDILATDAVRPASNLAILLGRRRSSWLCAGQDAAGCGIWPRLLFDLHLRRSNPTALVEDTTHRLLRAASAADVRPMCNTSGHGLWRQAATLLASAPPTAALDRHLHPAFAAVLLEPRYIAH